jgi:hypothetical protein
MLNCYYNNNVSKFPYPVYVDDLVVNLQKKIIISIILVKFSLGNYEKKNCPLTSSTFNISLLWIIIYPKVLTEATCVPVWQSVSSYTTQ